MARKGAEMQVSLTEDVSAIPLNLARRDLAQAQQQAADVLAFIYLIQQAQQASAT